MSEEIDIFTADVANVTIGKPDETVDPEVEKLTIHVNAKGEIEGDTSHLPPEILEQLKSQKRTRDMYRANKYGEEPRKPVRMLTTIDPNLPRALQHGAERRDFTNIKPVGMSSKDFSRIRRQKFRKMTKATIKIQKGLPHG